MDALGAGTKLTELGREQATQLKRYLKQPGKRPAGNDRKVLSDASVRKTVKTVSSVLRRAEHDGLIDRNPFEGQARGKTQSKKKRIYSPEELEAMIDAARSQWWAVFIDVLVNSGVRKSEALHTQWPDIDFDEGTLTVARKLAGSFTVGEEELPILEWEAKAHEERTVPLLSSTLDRLSRFQLASGGSLYVFLSLDRLQCIRRRMEAGTWKPTSELMNNLLTRFKAIQDVLACF